MARSVKEDNIDIFRLRKTRTMEGSGLDYSNYEGPYSTLGATKARMAWNRGYDELVVQKLVAVYAYPPYLEWQDIDDIQEY